MANTAPKVAEKERHEAPSSVDQKAQQLADMIKSSKHMIAFTGAGISTSAGIPDFRGPDGVWTLRAQGRNVSKATNTMQAIPTLTHMALVALQDRGLLKYLISQNCDGLHRKSGILPDKISELHGNSTREYCKDCNKEYIRDFRAVAKYEKTVRDHRTGRKCVVCGGVLLDSIINFGESLWEEPLQLARDNAKAADLCLALGSSLTVTPANEIPETVARKKRSRGAAGGRLAICNLQSTPLDELAELRVWSATDELMARVMEKVDIPIPTFILRRNLLIELETTGEERHRLTVRGADVDGTAVTFLQSVKVQHNRRVARAEPFVVDVRGELELGALLKLDLEFMGHYGEPGLEVEFEYRGEEKSEASYLLEYNPMTGEWKTTKKDEVPGVNSRDGGAEVPDISVIDLTED
ncbi:silent information regulator family protein [Colletotrichum musicola]|uniref:protein acetyllysine N-acetyltransferase n=1 Tax=Colletotrichum musicola TaxID=2175873 RepID=A0A8H6KJ48_9PEZI|nr:silent information regulator family protein [Colletotrichum musicola]